MAMLAIPLADQSNQGRDFRDGSGRLINCYVEPRGKEGKHPAPVYPVDGLRFFADIPAVEANTEAEGSLQLEDGTGNYLTETGDTIILEGDPFGNQGLDPALGVQHIIEDRGSLWVITGNGVYKCDYGGETTFIGGIANSEAITADKNRSNQIGIVSEGNYYVLDTVFETLTQYNDQLTFTSPNSVCHYNGYMVLTFENGTFQHSGLNDATTFSVNDIATASYRGDGAYRCLVRGFDLLIFGRDSIEFWQDVGNSNAFTYNRVGGIEVGIGPSLSAINVDEAILFIDSDWEVRMCQGYQTQVVSTNFVARKIREASNPWTIRASTYDRDGHTFYSISCSDFTLTYNMATGLWHEEQSYGFSRRLISCTEKVGNTIYAGHYAEGTIFTIDRSYHQDNATPLVMEVVTPPVHTWPDKIRFKSLFIDALFGNGLPADVDADEADPKLLVYVSEDGGENFVFLEELSLGDINSKYEELRIQGIGTSQQNGFVFRLVCSTPVVRGILGMHADISKVRA